MQRRLNCPRCGGKRLWAIEQASLSIAYANMNVKMVASHPGQDVGPDGASAQCLEDLAAFRAIPGMVVLSPCDPLEIEQVAAAGPFAPGMERLSCA